MVVSTQPFSTPSVTSQVHRLPDTNHAAPFLAAAQPKFTAAYITLVNANSNGWNTQPLVSFKRNEPYSFPIAGAHFSHFDSDNLQLKGMDRPEFWAFSVVFGYQPELWEDGEPNTEEPSAGETNKKLRVQGVGPSGSVGFSVVWVESIRERIFGVGRGGVNVTTSAYTNANQLTEFRLKYVNDLYGTVAHEIGHSPGRQDGGQDHAEEGIMETGALKGITAPIFEPKSIKRFWDTESWTR